MNRISARDLINNINIHKQIVDTVFSGTEYRLSFIERLTNKKRKQKEYTEKQKLDLYNIRTTQGMNEDKGDISMIMDNQELMKRYTRISGTSSNPNLHKQNVLIGNKSTNMSQAVYSGRLY